MFRVLYFRITAIKNAQYIRKHHIILSMHMKVIFLTRYVGTYHYG